MLFLFGFEAAIWHFRGATTCFYWASKLPSGTFPADLQRLKTLPAALPWDFPRPHELFLLETAIWQCFCWASKLLSGISEALQPVSIGLRNCHLARFQQPLKALKPSQQLCHGTSRGPRNCFCWPSKLLSVRNCHPPSSFAMGFPRPHELFLLGFEAAIWHFRGATTSFYWASKLPSGTFPAPLKSLKTLPAALPWDFPRPQELFLLAFEAAICSKLPPSQQLCHGIPQAPRTVSVGLRSCYLALPRCHNLFLLGFETAIWHVSSTP